MARLILLVGLNGDMQMEININAEDIKLIRKFEEILQRGYYASSQQVTDCYNRVLGKRVPNTNCSSCLRARISELVNALNAFESKIASQEKDKENNLVKEEEDKKETMKDRMAKARAAKGKK